jgi:hypothetical protein
MCSAGNINVPPTSFNAPGRLVISALRFKGSPFMTKVSTIRYPLNTNYPAYDLSFFSDEALMSPALNESSNATKGINVECPEHGL